MKSGKSYDLISFFAPLKYTTIPFALFQSSKHVRDQQITSRNGASLEAKQVLNLEEALKNEYKVIGVDETHMFTLEDVEIIDQLLKKQIKIILSGLDLDYRGKMFPVIQALFELGPKEVRYRRAVCEVCKSPEAMYTQVLSGVVPIISGMPSVLPDDGAYSYRAVCKNCFVRI